MDNIKSYESIVSSYETLAREAGYYVDEWSNSGMWRWYKTFMFVRSAILYNTPEEAWKACCVENGLV
jgi:hypothetical protein